VLAACRIPWPTVVAAASALLPAAVGAPAEAAAVRAVAVRAAAVRADAVKADAVKAGPPPAATPGAAAEPASEPAPLVDLDGRPVDPFAAAAAATVVLFVRSDCPISNRYAPEVRRIWDDFAARGVAFHLVYADPTEPVATIRRSTADFGYPLPALRDPAHRMVERVGATVTPEVAVFDAGRRLVYRGRIDDRWASLGRPRAAPTRRDLVEVLEALVAGERLEPRTTKAVGCFIPAFEEEPAGSDARP
jgi:hypothetical protein